MTGHFATTLNYSSVNEDWDTELRALEAAGDDTVLCITGSGARPLAILARTDARVVALDVNPAQNHLLRLKVAAIDALDPPELRAWLGVEPADGPWRLEVYRHRVAPGLPPGSRRWWDHRTGLITGGVIYGGRWERHFRRVAHLARRIWPVETLTAFDDLAEQRRWLARHWDDRRWRAAWWLVCHPMVSRLVFGDPAFHGALPVHPGPYLRRRMRHCLEDRLVRESFMASLVLTGKLSRHDLPPHLTVDGVKRVRERLHALDIVDGDALSHLRRTTTGHYTRFSLSDLPSFLELRALDALWREVVRVGAPGARAVMREFLRHHRLPAGLPIRRETALEMALMRADRSFAYDFVIAVVRERT